MFGLTNYDLFSDFFNFNQKMFNDDSFDVDIIKKENAYILKANVPGVKKEDVKVSLENGCLSINVRYHNKLEQDEQYIQKERKEGEMSRYFSVDRSLTNKDIAAYMEDGVLTVVVKKRQPIKDKKAQDIEIQ